MKSESDSRQGQRFFFSMQRQTESGAHEASYLPGGRFPKAKRTRREADHSPVSSAEVKNACSSTLTIPHVCMAQSVKCGLQPLSHITQDKELMSQFLKMRK